MNTTTVVLNGTLVEFYDLVSTTGESLVSFPLSSSRSDASLCLLRRCSQQRSRIYHHRTFRQHLPLLYPRIEGREIVGSAHVRSTFFCLLPSPSVRKTMKLTIFPSSASFIFPRKLDPRQRSVHSPNRRPEHLRHLEQLDARSRFAHRERCRWRRIG